LDELHHQLFHEPKKLAIVGSGGFVATEAAAEVSHYYNIPQVSLHNIIQLRHMNP
jgi:hypothetical protein